MRSIVVFVGGLTVLALSATWHAAVGAAASVDEAGGKVAERIDADPHGNVEIGEVAGSVEIEGWDKPQVEVTGSAGADVERVAVTGDAAHVRVEVVTRQNRQGGSKGAAKLTVRVPLKSTVSATLVSADLRVNGLLGDLKVQSVSGAVQGAVGGNLRVASVSGDVRLAAKSARSISINTVSGDVTLTAGEGDTEVSTVSGDVKVEEGAQSQARFKSVSGDMNVRLGLTTDAQIEGQSVSGNIVLMFAAVPLADFDVQSFSGEIRNCFGPKPAPLRPGSGSRLVFKTGDSGARLQIGSKSGDIGLCAQPAAAAKPSA